MTVKQMIDELLKEGYSVTYRKRSDGGYLITSINGNKFELAKGNTLARTLLGERLSSSRAEQLKTIAPPKIIVNKKTGEERYLTPKERKLDPVDDDIKKELRRVQRIFKKYATEEMKKYRTMPTLKKLRYNIKTYGKEEAMRLLKSAEYYAKGIAYPENVEWLISILDKISSESEYASEWNNIIAKIESMKGTTFTESMLKDINGGSGSILYMLEQHAIKEEDAINAIKKIIGLS